MTIRLIELGESAILNCKDLSTLPLERVAGVPAMVLESVGPFRHAANVPFHDSQARGKAILIRTGWDELRGTPAYQEPGPYLHEELIFRLIRARVQLVGLDFGNSNYQELVEKDIPVIECLSKLNSIPRWGTRFYAVPPRVAGKSATIRAFSEVTSVESA
jgi:kynurenine formamidase